jgi:hypothetical protein
VPLTISPRPAATAAGLRKRLIRFVVSIRSPLCGHQRVERVGMPHVSSSAAPSYPQTSRATSTTSRNFAHCSSWVRAFASSVEANPHCGERQSWSRGFVDPPLQLIFRLELAALRRHETQHDLLGAFRQEPQGLEVARALVVPLHEEAVDREIVQQRLGDEVVAALGRPGGAEVAPGRGSSSPTCIPAGRPGPR